ncbi:hypothetical protein IW262DRAFT_1389048 [Armillaria fumosa]|nr:hypothetical protein IW262DRAFT_1389048 [Armillaria fumosa]
MCICSPLIRRHRRVTSVDLPPCFAVKTRDCFKLTIPPTKMPSHSVDLGYNERTERCREYYYCLSAVALLSGNSYLFLLIQQSPFLKLKYRFVRCDESMIVVHPMLRANAKCIITIKLPIADRKVEVSLRFYPWRLSVLLSYHSPRVNNSPDEMTRPTPFSET